MQIREGKLISSEVIILPLSDKQLLKKPGKVLLISTTQIAMIWPLPKDILLELEIDDHHALSEILSERANFSVNISVPKRGEKQRLINLAKKNAEAF